MAICGGCTDVCERCGRPMPADQVPGGVYIRVRANGPLTYRGTEYSEGEFFAMRYVDWRDYKGAVRPWPED